MMGANDIPEEKTPEELEKEFATILKEKISELASTNDVDGLISLIPNIARLKSINFLPIAQLVKNFKGLNQLAFRSALKEARESLAGEEEATEKSTQLDFEQVANEVAGKIKDEWVFDELENVWRIWTGTHWNTFDNEHMPRRRLDNYIVKTMQELHLELNSASNLDIVQRRLQEKCKRVLCPKVGQVNFKNGTLDLHTMKLHGHTKEDEMLDCFEYDFSDQGSYPETLKFYAGLFCIRGTNDAGESIWETDMHAVQAFMVHIGLGMLRDVKIHKFEILIGAPGAGKSTCMRHANSLFGNAINKVESSSEIKYGSFAGDEIFFKDIEGKRARYKFHKYRMICVDEIEASTFRENEANVKNMSAHSGVPMRGMFKDTEDTNIWRPKLLLSSNELPNYKDLAGAMNRRAVFLPTPRKLKEDEYDLDQLDKLVVENGSFARDCIQLAKLALKRGYIPQSTTMKRFAHIATQQGSIIKAFVEECCVISGNARVHISTLYRALAAYREDNGSKNSYTKQTMRKELTGLNEGIIYANKTIKIGDTSEKGIYGIRLKTEDEKYSEEEQDFAPDTLLVEEVTFLKKGHLFGFSEAASQADADGTGDKGDFLEKKVTYNKVASQADVEEKGDQTAKNGFTTAHEEKISSHEDTNNNVFYREVHRAKNANFVTSDGMNGTGKPVYEGDQKVTKFEDCHHNSTKKPVEPVHKAKKGDQNSQLCHLEKEKVLSPAEDEILTSLGDF